MSMLLFYVGENGYAIDSRYILRIVPQVELKKRPFMPFYIAGFLNLGGKAIPIIDFSQLIEQRATRPLLLSRIILLQILQSGSERILGVLGEKVKDLLPVELEEFSQADFSFAPFPYLSQILSTNHEVIQYLDVEKFFHFLSADLAAEKEDHES